VRALFLHDHDLFLDYLKGVYRHAHYYAGGVFFVLVDDKRRVAYRLAGRAYRKLRKTRRTPGFVPAEDFYRVEILDLARDLGGMIGCVKRCDLAYSGYTFYEGVPELLSIQTIRRYYANACDNRMPLSITNKIASFFFPDKIISRIQRLSRINILLYIRF